jgi:ribonuclease HI
VFTDGSCRVHENRAGGWAAVRVEYDTVVDEVFGYELETTNNRMELRALAEGLRLIRQDETEVVYCDSKYALDCVAVNYLKFVERGWLTFSGTPVKNRELIEDARHELDLRPGVTLEWVRGHNGERWNAYVDLLSRAYQHVS